MVYTGLRDPQWRIGPGTYRYQEIISLQLQARRSGYTYQHICIPPETGYKGFLIEGNEGEALIVGSETVHLQLLLLDHTMPTNLAPTGGFRQRIRREITSKTVSEDCLATARRKRHAPPYRPDRWNTDRNIRRNNNCYNYANTLITNTFAQPGLGSGQKYGRITADEVRDAAVRDGMIVLNTAAGDPVPRVPGGDRHLVALVVERG